MIRTENIDLAFLNHYTDGIFTGLHGRASGWTRVFGPFKGINLEGDMLVSEGGMKVNATEVDYRLVNDSVILRPDNIYFRNAMVYDRQGSPGKDEHYAVVNGVLQHSNLSHMRFDFDIDAYNILGYDVKDFGGRSVLRDSIRHRKNRVQRTAGQPEHQHRCPPRRKHHVRLQPVLSNDFDRQPVYHLQDA